jgi:hypothetical protein
MKNVINFLFLLTLLLVNKIGFCQYKKTVSLIDTLSLSKYSEAPVYIVNKKYVVYEFGETRKIIYADIPSFKALRYAYNTVFALDKNGVYFMGKLIDTDTTGFKLLGYSDNVSKGWFWKNKYKVYKDDIELLGVDAGSFESVRFGNGRYFKDKKHLYYYDREIKDSDPATVNQPMLEICYDKNSIYSEGHIAYTNNNEKLFPVNERIAKTRKNAFSVSMYGNRLEINKIVKTMDAASLKGLSRSFSMDKYHVYYDTIVLPITPDRFKYIKIWDQVNRAYISDGLHVYAGANLQPAFDAESFGMFPKSDFCYDKNGVYGRIYKEGKFPGINVKFPFEYSKPVNEQTVRRVGLSYYIYEHQIYDPWDDILYTNFSDKQIAKLMAGMGIVKYENEPVNNYGQGLYRFNSKFYYKGIEIKGIDQATFNSTPYGYADKDHVYLEFVDGHFQILPDADPKTYKNLMNGFCYDKNNLFYGTKKLISSESMELLVIFWGRHTWHGDEGDAGPPDFDRYFFRNKYGYWLITNESKPQILYLGSVFSPKWNTAFENFELPSN